MKLITENNIESSAIEQFQSLGWVYIHALAITPGAEQSIHSFLGNTLL